MNNLEMTNVELVEVRNQQVVTDSRKVAEVFEKEHKTVLRSIENIKAQAKNGFSEHSAQNCAQSFFYETIYKDGSGKSNKMYYMNRDGLSLLVMGFTGKKAMNWKIKYIEAFNAMEEKLKAMEKPMTAADMFLQNAKLMKEHELQLAKLTEETQLIKDTQRKQQSTIDTLNGVCTDETKRQKLNRLVRSYANTHGVQYADAWNLFKEMYNNAYHTNLNLRITNYAKSNFLKKRPSVPQYFELTNQLDDALRIAEKM